MVVAQGPQDAMCQPMIISMMGGGQPPVILVLSQMGQHVQQAVLQLPPAEQMQAGAPVLLSFMGNPAAPAGGQMGGPMYGAPMGGQMYGAPMGGQTYGAPMGGQTYGAPMGGQTYGAPMGGQTYGAPMGGQTYGAPMGGQTYGAPMGGQTYGVPMGGQAYGAPMGGQMCAPPMGGQAYGAPMGGQVGQMSPAGIAPPPPRNLAPQKAATKQTTKAGAPTGGKNVPRPSAPKAGAKAIPVRPVAPR